MFLKLIDVFRFFSETEWTYEQSIYELICVSALCVILLIILIILFIRKKKKNKATEEKK